MMQCNVLLLVGTDGSSTASVNLKLFGSSVSAVLNDSTKHPSTGAAEQTAPVRRTKKRRRSAVAPEEGKSEPLETSRDVGEDGKSEDKPNVSFCLPLMT